MTARQKLQQLRLAARQFTVETITSVSGRRPSTATVERVTRHLVNTLKPVLQDDNTRPVSPAPRG